MGGNMAEQQSGFLTIAEAAEMLGVAPNTLRSWGAAGKVAEYRHPINNYRLYKREDMDALAVTLQNPPKTGGRTRAKRRKRPR
ncbi:MAG TPA: MerR family DNA-binding transcriptional regulator [Pirellulaceae bacterium]|nr:MerR family DNA-binding transcriptional regulator [Pirellulaceae bacterium]